ncbi:hypothetical protein CF319_g9338 [Tilletia indica]|nr:hypothetical protein CF319_g9338 [Tilletia indica]
MSGVWTQNHEVSHVSCDDHGRHIGFTVNGPEGRRLPAHIDITIFDGSDTARQASLKIWSRTCPTEGAYILNNVPCASDPIQIHVPDIVNLRKIPEEFDGSNPDNPTLTPTQPTIAGLAVIQWVDDTKKTCVRTGFSFMGKDKAWVLFKVRASFEDVPRFANWTVPAPRTSAPPFLLSALDIGKSSAGDKAAKLREVRLKAGQRAKPEVKDDVFNQTPKNASTIASSSALILPPIPNPPRSGTANAPPSSPTPVGPNRKVCLSPVSPAITRKRARSE